MDPIIFALEQQVACYQRLAKLADAQHEHVQHSAMEELLDVLAQRQEVLEQLAPLEQTLGPVKKQWAQYVAQLDAGSRTKAEELLAETRRLLEQITAADRNDAIVLQQRKTNLSRQIVQTGAAKRVNQKYAAAAYGARKPTMDVQR